MNIRLILPVPLSRNRFALERDSPEVKMKEGWNDTGQKTAAELKNLRMLKERPKSTLLSMSAACYGQTAGTIG